MTKYDVLKEYFGHDSFREGQEEIIDNILSGRDVFGIMPTGAGKSVCYQVPAMLMDGITIVISPLISLMKDQVNALVSSGISAAYINSSLTLPQYNEVFRRASSGVYKIIYVAPERLTTNEFLNFTEKNKISMITVDEAHCVSQWGQDFRPSYRKIKEFIHCLSYRPIISAFTATATAEVRNDISKMLELKNPLIVTASFNRKNLYFGVIKPHNKYIKLTELLNSYKEKCGIIYCISRKNVEEICQKLNDDGFSATRYHAGLSDTERQKNQEDFIYDRKLIMVATNAFGMGIDKSNVSFVIHYNMPKNPESYYQEAGRAGRDGSQADCILMYNGNDVRTNQFLIENGHENNQELTEQEILDIKQRDFARLKTMNLYCSTTGCLREYILRYFDEDFSGNCGNCSNCLGNYETIDITLDAQKIISCVYRIYQKNLNFGIKMIIDILAGSKNERLLKFGLDKLSTYGIMSGMKTDRIRRITSFLIENGWLIQTDEEFPTVRFSHSSASILRGEKKLEMKLPKETKIQNKHSEEEKFFADNILFEKLRNLRTSIAQQEHVPAYIVFTDATLKDMCHKLPATIDEFMEVSGVGRQKAKKYSNKFCSLIKEYISENPNEPTAPEVNISYIDKELSSYRELAVSDKTYPAFRPWLPSEDDQLHREIHQGLNMSQIAASHNRSISEIALRIKKL